MINKELPKKTEMELKQRLALISRALQKDPGGRGLLTGGVDNPVEALYDTLKDVDRAVILTGYPVRTSEGQAVGETDGPSGTADLAWALEQSKADVIPLTDRFSLAQLKAAFLARGCKAVPRKIPDSGQQTFFEKLLETYKPTHLITLERPGKASDGHFYNMRGRVIDDMVSDSDSAIEAARRNHAVVISVGDGGNELGMGSLRPLIEERVPHGRKICADLTADITLASGVSNWWGMGMAAFLSMIGGSDLLPAPEMEQRVLRAVIASGGADGCTKLAEESVDALPLNVHLELLAELRSLISAFLRT